MHLWLRLEIDNVATREGGVDRNCNDLRNILHCNGSPPARVAWIETQAKVSRKSVARVATREGGVDRNTVSAFIRGNTIAVATREGGVDRNVKADKL